MPNICSFEMHINGKKKNVQKLLNYLNAEYSYQDNKQECYLLKGKKRIPIEHHIGYRVFEFAYDENFLKDFKSNDEICVYGYGNCAWSCHCCMFDGEWTYYNDRKVEPDNFNKYGYAITLPEACKMLKLNVELYSTEPGCCFAEHYIINDNGEISTNESIEYYEHWLGDYETYNDYLKENEGVQNLLSEEQFNDAAENGEDTVIDCEWIENNEEFSFSIV